MDWKGCGEEAVLSRNLPGGTEENHQKDSVKIAGLWADIWTCDLPHMKQEC
jgi:hypothetical protein